MSLPEKKPLDEVAKLIGRLRVGLLHLYYRNHAHSDGCAACVDAKVLAEDSMGIIRATEDA